jgi:hypothetical protein
MMHNCAWPVIGLYYSYFERVFIESLPAKFFRNRAEPPLDVINDRINCDVFHDTLEMSIKK